MKKIIRYKQFLNENYDFNITNSNDKEVIYTFVNRDDIKFKVYFDFDSENFTWNREYRIDGSDAFRELEKPDAINVLRTVTNITIDFIKNHKPNKITIEHIPTDSEGKANKKYDSSIENKRTRANKRLLLQELPNNYRYTNDGSTSFITRIG